ncbi:MAG: SOS response-associated peptidase [Phycisphaerales bacterium]|nr:SOS response-associated peptidase [Phycisphaerales bacterium]
MCGRYTIVDPGQAADMLEPDEIEADLRRPRYNIAPTQKVPALLVRNGRRVLAEMQWGLVPAWARDKAMGVRLINARAETLSEKPAFRNALRKSRCLIPADGFYEWQKQGARKIPMYIRLIGGRPFAFAGLFELWRGQDEELLSCTIITTEADEPIRPIHERMPVILPCELYRSWLDPSLNDKDAISSLLRPVEGRMLEAYPVSSHVNSPRNDDPGCIMPCDVKE